MKHDRKIFTDHLVVTAITTILIGIIVLAVVYFGGRKIYDEFKISHAVSEADEFVAENDIPNAVLSLQRALIVDPENAKALEKLADLAAESRSPAAISLYKQLLTIAPQNVEARIKLAQLAVTTDAKALAKINLEAIPEDRRDSVAYQNAASALAMAENRYADAESHATTALEFDPDNGKLKVNLAAVLLRSGNPDNLKKINQIVKDLQAQEEFAPSLYRLLIMQAATNNDIATSLELSNRLLETGQVTAQDKIQRLDILQANRSADFESTLAAYRDEFSQNARSAVMLASWMMGNGLSKEAGAWLDSLPDNVRKTTAVSIARIDAAVANGDWQMIIDRFSNIEWTEMDFIRSAVLARAHRMLNQSEDAQTQWLKALKAAGNESEALHVLSTVILSWEGWREENTELLRRLSETPVYAEWALRRLQAYYQQIGDTISLHRVSERLMDVAPEDPMVENNYVSISLLRNRDTSKMHLKAKKLYDERPDHPVHITTYAFSLFMRGEYSQAYDLMKALPEPFLYSQPEIAAYYVAISRAAGETPLPRAVQAASGATLLPEERNILQAEPARTN